MGYPIEKYAFYVSENQKQVIAVSTYAGRKIKGVAKCDPRDEFSLEKGKGLAAVRCALKIAEKRAKRAARKYKEAIAESDARFKYAQKMQDYLINSNNELLEIKEKLKTMLVEY